ncbi:MAG: hypothetical protein JJU36_06230 [Phycisphaeraceae bacterium]|nr:hypothetical protein [Phycisphaeraceae bacterium]
MSPTALPAKQPQPGRERTGAQRPAEVGWGMPPLDESSGALHGDPASAHRPTQAVPLAGSGPYTEYRRMLADPTLALARASVMGPILSAGWAVEARTDAPGGAEAMIRRQLDPIRTLVLRDCLRAMDYGWAGFEKVWSTGRDPATGRPELRLARVKPLLADITRIMVEKDNGRFAGFLQGRAYVPVSHALLYTYDREGDELYGRSRLENCRDAWRQWQGASESAERYDRKVAGVYVMVHYPPGRSVGPGGRTMDNFQIAQQLAASITANRPVVVPRSLDEQETRLPGETDPKAWLIELKEDRGGRHGDFIQRLRYLDAIKVRGYLRPERSLLEASEGTRADAETHVEAGLADSELVYGDILRHLNWHVVDPLLAWNHGESARGTVWLQPAPLRARRLSAMSDLLEKVLAHPEGGNRVVGSLDLPAVLDLLDVPRSGE